MPTPVLKSLAKKAGVSMDRAEKLWANAKKVAKKAGKDKDYAYITGIWKKSAKLESRTDEDILIDKFMNGATVDQILNERM